MNARGRWAFAATVAALLWGLLIMAAAVVVPVYHGISATSDGHTTITRAYSSTLVGENGLRVLVPLAIPVLLVAIAWLALHRKCSRGSAWGSALAWSLVALLAFFALATAITVGVFFMPLVVLLAAAAVLTPYGARPSA